MIELPVAGLVVIELGHSIAAPYAGLVLADLGAEVIKVERAGVGDPVRDWGPPYTEATATVFESYNGGKAGIEVDLRDPVQVAALRRLIVERADVVLQNLKAGAADRAGLGAAALTALKPSLIYCNMHAFGATGPLRDRPGYDPLMQAYGGLMSVTGEASGRPPVRIGVSIVDMGAGMWAVIGILAALAARRRDGTGGVVDVSLYETAIGWMMWPLSAYFASGDVPGPQGSGMATIVPYQVFDSRDSSLMVAAANDGLFARLCAAIGRPDLAADERFASNGRRVAHRDALVAELVQVFAARDTADWVEILTAAGVPAAAIQDVAAVAAAPQTHALGIIAPGPDGAARQVGLPLSFNGVRPPPRGRAPARGADTRAILGSSLGRVEN
jgi:crotonobetainyl-CoA:carnitine CoA-transferase CaiB-like acyl-CoA transferase